VKERFAEDARYNGVPAGAGRALLEQVLNNPETYHEAGARGLLEDFVHDGYRFSDVWEMDFRSYDWWFLWALHAIVWGIALYDAEKAGAGRPVFPVPPMAEDAEPPPDPAETGRPMVTVNLPGDGA